MVLRIMVVIFLAVIFFWLILLIACAKFVTDKLKRRKRMAIAELHSYRLRLHLILSELMGRANELDQHRRYVVLPVNDQTSHKLAGVCQDLIVLTDSLPMIEHLLKQGNLKHGRRDILVALNSAARLNKHLDNVSVQLKVATDSQMLSSSESISDA